VNKGTKGKSGKRKAKAGSKPKPKRRGLSYKGTAKRARERAPEAMDPKVAIIAKDPLRAEILAIGIQRPISPSEFSREKGISLGVASYAFRVLEEHRIIELVDLVQVRGATKHVYRANEAAFIGDKDWGALAPVLRPGVIGATFGNFNGRVAEAEETGKLYEREDVRIYWAPRDYDETAWKDHAEILAWCIEESERLEADTVARRASGESDGAFKATVGLFLFPSPTHSEVKAHEREMRKKEREAGKGKASKSKATGKATKGKGKEDKA
jgi:ribosomal protein S25